MRLSEEEVKKYYGVSLESLLKEESKQAKNMVLLIRNYELKVQSTAGKPILDYLVYSHHILGKSLRRLGSEMGVSVNRVIDIFDRLDFPKLDKIESSKIACEQNLKDEDYSKKVREKISKSVKNLWKDPEYRRRGIKQLNNTRERAREAHRYRFEHDQNYRSNCINKMKDTMKGEKYREKQSRRMKQYILEHPEFMKKIHEKARNQLLRKWQDPLQREKGLIQLKKAREAQEGKIKKLWYNCSFREEKKQFLRFGIFGYRRDIGFEAKSMMEANLARIFMHSNREFGHEFLLYSSDGRSSSMDFLVPDKMNRPIIYNILSSLRSEVDIRRYFQIMQEYPGYKFKEITLKKYFRLESFFKEKINNSSRFCGWECRGDNLRVSPLKYGEIV